jgi:hypothetical protein
MMMPISSRRLIVVPMAAMLPGRESEGVFAVRTAETDAWGRGKEQALQDEQERNKAHDRRTQQRCGSRRASGGVFRDSPGFRRYCPHFQYGFHETTAAESHQARRFSLLGN